MIKSYFVFSLVFILITINSVAQKHDEGEFDIVTSYSYSLPNIDSFRLQQMKENSFYFEPSKVVFNKSKAALIYTYKGGMYKRVVYDYENRKIITFKYPKYYYENESFHVCFTQSNKLGINNYEIKELTDLNYNVLGNKTGTLNHPIIKKEMIENINCNVYTMYSSELEKIWYSDQIVLPYLNYSKYNPRCLDDLQVCMKQISYYENIIKTYEIINFRTKIENVEYLSTDIEKYKSPEFISRIYQKLCDSIEANKTYEYRNIGGENSQKVIKLLNRCLFYESEYPDSENSNYDFYSLVSNASVHFRSQNFDSLNLILYQDNIITEQEFQLFNEYHRTCKLKGIDYKNTIRLYAINKILSQNKTRNFIISGLKKSALTPKELGQKNYNKFLNGELDLGTLLSSYREILPVELSKHFLYKSDMVSYIKSFIGQLLPQLVVNVNEKRDGFDFVINHKNYSFNFDEFFNDGKEFKDTIRLDAYQYNSILKRVKQIAIDNSIDSKFIFNSFISLLEDDISEYEYDEITSVYPNLKLFSISKFVAVFSKSQFDSSELIKLSFDGENAGITSQLYLKNMFSGDLDLYKEYFPTDKKIKFAKIINKYKEEIGLSEKEYKRFSEKLFQNLWSQLDEMLSILPIKRFIISGRSKEFPIIESGKSFEDIFYSLSYFLNGSLDPNKIQDHETGPYFLTFFHKGRKVGVKYDFESKWTSLLKVFDIILIKEQNKSIYEFQKSYYETSYYILNIEMAQELFELFGHNSFGNIK